MNRFFARHLHWLRREPVWLIAALVVVGGIWGFVKLAEEMIEGDTQAFDERVVRALRQSDDLSRTIGPPWLAEAGRDITGLGGVSVLALVTIAVSGFLYVRRGHRMMVLLLATVLSGLALSLLLKTIFGRPRPDVVPHLAKVASSSFPSGHSMMSAVVYLTLAAIVATTLPERSHKLYVFAIAFTVTVLVGCSRVYLGVHYPTDVLAGWTVGLIWALLAWLITHWLQRRHSVEQPTEIPDLTA